MLSIVLPKRRVEGSLGPNPRRISVISFSVMALLTWVLLVTSTLGVIIRQEIGVYGCV